MLQTVSALLVGVIGAIRDVLRQPYEPRSNAHSLFRSELDLTVLSRIAVVLDCAALLDQK